jgi:hypothetical protein
MVNHVVQPPGFTRGLNSHKIVEIDTLSADWKRVIITIAINTPVMLDPQS